MEEKFEVTVKKLKKSLRKILINVLRSKSFSTIFVQRDFFHYGVLTVFVKLLWMFNYISLFQNLPETISSTKFPQNRLKNLYKMFPKFS